METIKNNYLGFVLGAGVAYLLGKKYGKFDCVCKLVGATALGAVAGVYVQKQIKAYKSKPTAELITKK